MPLKTLYSVHRKNIASNCLSSSVIFISPQGLILGNIGRTMLQSFLDCKRLILKYLQSRAIVWDIPWSCYQKIVSTILQRAQITE